MGGRETALVHLGEQWARQGHEVVNLVPVKRPFSKTYDSGGNISYVDNGITYNYLSNFNSDALVSWEEPRIFGVPDIRKKIKFSVIEMQVAHLYVTTDDGKSLDHYVDGYAVLSKWAGDFLSKNEPSISKKKISILPQGVDLKRFPTPKTKHPGHSPYNFHYSSSPDRGLHHLLKLWPQILKLYPGSKLHIAYGIEKWTEETKWTHNLQSEIALDVLEGIKQEGIVYHGRIGQDKLAKIIYESDLLLYSCDTMSPTETGCATILESLAAGTPVITTDCDCIDSEFSSVSYQSKLPFDEDDYLSEIVYILNTPDEYQLLQKDGRFLAEQRDWPVIADQWVEYLEAGIAC